MKFIGNLFRSLREWIVLKSIGSSFIH